MRFVADHTEDGVSLVLDVQRVPACVVVGALTDDQAERIARLLNLAVGEMAEEIDRKHVQEDLLAVFRHYGLSVAVGLTSKGVAIRSQDERVDASNLGKINVQLP